MLVFITDKSRLERHFRIDPVLYAYCLGDLEEPWFSKSQWAGFYTASGNIAEDRHVQEVALIFNHGDSCTLQAFAQSELLGEEIHLLAPMLPDLVHLHVNKLEIMKPLLGEFEIVSPARPMLKMSLTKRPDILQNTGKTSNAPKLFRLTGADTADANRLYRAAYPEAEASESSLDAAPWFGFRENGKMVAIGGCHVWSDSQKVVTIGGVATHPEFRNHGYAAAIVAEILKLAPKDFLVCLNVTADNATAQNIYSRLGFVKTHEYWETSLKRK